MIDLISDNRAAIAALCRQYGVESLDVFGAAATGEPDERSNDGTPIDFIVKFDGASPEVAANRYLEFAEAVERLLQRPVDLKFDYRTSRPYLQESINASRENVFERAPRHEIS